MAKLSVWAPKASLMEAVVGGARSSMQKASGGWWCIDSSSIVHGVDYAFFVDGKGPFPDPRSAWQPQGVHGPSRYVDHSLYKWSDASWKAPTLDSSIFYELHVGTFTSEGTFDAAILRLDYLVDLGITHIELMPVCECSGSRGWGYDGVDLYAPHHAYGGPIGLKRLVDACHQKGLAVVLDVVYNHLGPEGSYIAQFGPYFTHKYSTPWGEAVNFDDVDSYEVRRFFIDNATMWVRDYHIDGLRIDAVHAIFDSSSPHILEELKAEVDATVVAESDLNDPCIIRPLSEHGYGLDAQWNEDFHHALHVALTQEERGYYQDFTGIQDLATVLNEGFMYGEKYSRYRGRIHGKRAEDIPNGRFIGFLQNHDQIGNRPFGERSSQLMSVQKLKIAACMVLLSGYHPLIFQGEEWAASSPFLFFCDYQDELLQKNIRKGRQAEFSYYGIEEEALIDPQSEEAFTRSKLNWQERDKMPHSELLSWYKALIALSKKYARSKAKAVCDEGADWLIVERSDLLLICNFADRAERVVYSGAEKLKPVLSSDPEIRIEQDAVVFMASGALVLVKSTI